MKQKHKFKPLTDIHGVGAVTESRLKKAGYGSIEAVAVSLPVEIARVANIDELTAQKVIESARRISDIGCFVSKDGKLVRRQDVDTNEIRVTGTLKLTLFDIPLDKGLWVYSKGHLIIQIQCTEKSAEEFMKAFDKFDTIQEQIKSQQERLDKNADMLNELKKKLVSLNPVNPEETDYIMYG